MATLPSGRRGHRKIREMKKKGNLSDIKREWEPIEESGGREWGRKLTVGCVHRELVLRWEKGEAFWVGRGARHRHRSLSSEGVQN